MSKPTAAEQATKASEEINQGAQLLVAFKTEPGQIILSELVTLVQEQLEALLFETLDDADALAKINACRAILQMNDQMGDKIRMAIEMVARRSVQSKLSVKKRLQEVSHEENPE